MPKSNGFANIIDTLRSGWFLIAFIAGMIYWVARQDNALVELDRLTTRITTLENRTTILETGIGQLQLKIDGIKEDLTLIQAVNACQNIHQSGLAGTVFAQQCMDLTFMNGEADAHKNRDTHKGFVDIFHFQYSHIISPNRGNGTPRVCGVPPQLNVNG